MTKLTIVGAALLAVLALSTMASAQAGRFPWIGEWMILADGALLGMTLAIKTPAAIGRLLLFNNQTELARAVDTDIILECVNRIGADIGHGERKLAISKWLALTKRAQCQLSMRHPCRAAGLQAYGALQL